MNDPYNLLLDGSLMKEDEFFKKLQGFIGCSFNKWTAKESTKSDGGNEWYRWEDEKYLVFGSVYEPPKLFEKHKEQ